MKMWKLAIVVIVLGVIGLFAYDGVQVLDARRNISDTASAAASAAAQAIATSKSCADAHPGATAPTCKNARAVADTTAKSQGDVVTSFAYDPIAARVSVTVSGNSKSLVLHYLDRNLTDNIRASSSARPE
jgi:Flp pilus assembly protein TadG